MNLCIILHQSLVVSIDPAYLTGCEGMSYKHFRAGFDSLRPDLTFNYKYVRL